ncbi:hypothetical protein BD626DRAFT_476127 [Schizophyllum amplum]|uniref:Uncharacterized protein n=1 Tax=Schizophyllum amplum TaxID=97359 RepID=A0A550CZ35_9AGAR|nr:hypothetical protein BD626DRAFT_476127 [Auriculariopsis ampla]
MSGESSAQEAENDFRIFLTQYRQHLKDIRAHFAGQTLDGADSEGQNEGGDETDDDNILEPGCGMQAATVTEDSKEEAVDQDPWTASEKDALFHGLAVHSRLRPDLIASRIQTKTIPEVCAFLEALENAASHHPLPDRRRDTLLPAMEVTDSWITWEERQAAHLLLAEPEWEAYAQDAQRQSILTAHPEDAPDSPRTPLLAQWKAQDALRALDKHRLRAMARILRHGEASAEDGSPPATSVPDDANLDPVVRGRSQSSTPSTRELSPKSRRRLQKRLYMRRKRAEKTGTEAVQDEGLLKVGRPAKARPPPKKTGPPRKRGRRGSAAEDADATQRNGDGSEEGEDEGNDEGDDGEEEAGKGDYAHPHKGGLTAPYKARRLLQEAGITPAVLAEHKLDMFDGIGVARFLEHARDDGTAISISRNTLALLYDILYDIVTEIVRRAIVSREQEVNLKAGNKAWRVKNPDGILPKNVEHALEMMGAGAPPRPGKRKRSADNEEDDGDNWGDEQEDGDGDEASASDTQVTSDAQDAKDAQEAQFDLAEDIYPAFFRLPSAYAEKHGDILPDDMDEEALERELDEEDELDAEDCVAQETYEENLWLSMQEQPAIN